MENAQGAPSTSQQRQGVEVDRNTVVEVDLGHLAVFDPSPLGSTQTEQVAGATYLRVGEQLMQCLLDRLFALPSEAVTGGRIVQLPEPSTLLPRARSLPKPKPLTPWQKFAKKRGIQKRKRSKLVYDEEARDWKQRHGYNRANEKVPVPIVEAGPADVVGEDPFTAAERQTAAAAARKQSGKNSKSRSADNGSRSGVPASIKLSAALRDGRSARQLKRKHLKDEIKHSSRQSGISTASMGKFDAPVKGEKPGERRPVRRKPLHPANTALERADMMQLANKIVRERSDSVIDVKASLGKMEARNREQRHQAKPNGQGEADTKHDRRRKRGFKGNHQNKHQAKNAKRFGNAKGSPHIQKRGKKQKRQRSSK